MATVVHQRQKEKGTAEDEMVGWHHRLNGRDSEQTPGDNEGQGSDSDWLFGHHLSPCWHDGHVKRCCGRRGVARVCANSTDSGTY